MSRGALRLTDEALAELRARIAQIADQIAERFAGPGTDGTWTRLILVLADLEDRPGPATPPASPA